MRTFLVKNGKRHILREGGKLKSTASLIERAQCINLNDALCGVVRAYYDVTNDQGTPTCERCLKINKTRGRNGR